MTANFINALGNLGSFGLNFASGTSVSKSNQINDYIAQLWRYNYKWSNLNGYSYMRKGLENAGYNPLLAIGASPQQGFAPGAVAQGDSVGINADIASGKQANVARDIAGSQVQLNQANALKSIEEGLTESNRRTNLDADTALKNVQSKEIWDLLPYKTKLLIAQQYATYTQGRLNEANAAAAPELAAAAQTSANAASTNAETNKNWTPAKIASGLILGTLGAGGLGLLGKGAKAGKFLRGFKKSKSSFDYYKDFSTIVH